LPPRVENAQPVTVPTACTLFPAGPYPIARRWAERRFHNLISWNEMDCGGHYPGWEQPIFWLPNSEAHSAMRGAVPTAMVRRWLAAQPCPATGRSTSAFAVPTPSCGAGVLSGVALWF
jgi:hypothetical protein